MTLALLLVVTAEPAPGATSGNDQSAKVAVDERVLKAVNRARSRAGLDPARLDAVLSEAARAHAAAMARAPRSERLSAGISLDHRLDRRGGAEYRRTWHRTDLTRVPAGVAVSDALQRWRAAPGAWEAATDPKLSRLGAGMASTEDGWRVIVIAMAEPLERDPAVLASWARRIAGQVNRIRTERGLAPLSWREDLAAVARRHSEAMAAGGFTDHVDLRGRRPADRLRAAGVTFRRAGENVASNKGTPSPPFTAVEGWMDSPGHRRQILDPGYRATGVGVALAADGTYYMTQVFIE